MANPNMRRKQTHQFKETARTDPNRSQNKSAGMPRCPVCRSVCVRGRWLPSAQARSKKPLFLISGELTCPACKQLEQRFALGVVELHGEHWKEKEKMVNNTIRRTEKIARVRNDQQRVLWTQERGGVTKVYVTLPELARRIGRELEKSFQGIAEYEHSTEEPYLRVRWWSDLPHMAHQEGAPLGMKRKSRAATGLRVESSEHKSRSFRGRSRRG
ncbi:MAG: hypothetical protein P4M08_06820 [Oligoflexia bacterium]|nr:hypothetical protein [Oligoflexia bacterium]